jgi:L-ascorbate metabolism protein UlaG (beta-lactamase superfamily)
MVISFYGLGMVKVQQGDFVMVFNPIGASPQVGTSFKAPRFGADIALASLRRADYHGLAEVGRGERVPLAIEGPGEYEAGGVFIRGVLSPGPEGLINTIYAVVLEEIKLVHLGALASADLTDGAKAVAASADILFVPVESLGAGLPAGQAGKAATLAASLEPKVMIPVGWQAEQTLQAFLKEAGAESVEVVESWQAKRKDLLDKEAEVVAIKSF